MINLFDQEKELLAFVIQHAWGSISNNRVSIAAFTKAVYFAIEQGVPLPCTAQIINEDDVLEARKGTRPLDLTPIEHSARIAAGFV